MSPCIGYFLRDWGSGDWISWDQNRRSKGLLIMRLTKFGFFHEIKSASNHLITWLRRFSWDWKLLILLFWVSISWKFWCNFDQEIKSLKSINFDFWSHDQCCVYKNVHEIRSLESIISNFHSHEKFVIHKCDHEIKSFYAHVASN